MNTESNIERINFSLTTLGYPIVIIIGPPGAGKTAVGLELAAKLNWDFYDTDVLIEAAAAMKITEIFAKYSEKAFRQLEQSLVAHLLKIFQANKHSFVPKSGTIISCGGGLPVPPQNFANLSKLGKIICLQASASVLTERIGQLKNRPLLNSDHENENVQNNKSEQLSRLEKLLSERRKIYAQAHYQIDTTEKSVEEVVKAIKNLLQL